MNPEAMPSGVPVPDPSFEEAEVSDRSRLVDAIWRRLRVENPGPENYERAIRGFEQFREFSLNEDPAISKAVEKFGQSAAIAGYKGVEIILNAGLRLWPDSEKLQSMRERTGDSVEMYRAFLTDISIVLEELRKKAAEQEGNDPGKA